MTTTTTTTPISATRRLLSISAAAIIAAAGLVALSAPAHAAPANSRCGCASTSAPPAMTRGSRRATTRSRVSGNAADEDKDGQVFVGDQFADAQGRSVVVQIGGDDPGAESCSPTPPPVIPSTTPPTASPTAQSDGGDDAGRRRTGYGW